MHAGERPLPGGMRGAFRRGTARPGRASSADFRSLHDGDTAGRVLDEKQDRVAPALKLGNEGASEVTGAAAP